MAAPLTAVHSVVPDDLRVIICLAFDPRAAPEAVASFKTALIECPCILHSVELSGTFDFMVEASVPDLASYHERLKSVAAPLAALARRYEANFVCNRFIRGHRAEHSIWVPCESGMQRIDHSLIDKVTAEGDYVRLHSGSQNWLLHATMRSLVDCLDHDEFIQIHRSIIVRLDFMERIIHRGTHWIARLNDGTLGRIAKSRVAAALHAVKHDSSIPWAVSSKPAHFVEAQVMVNEK